MSFEGVPQQTHSHSLQWNYVWFANLPMLLQLTSNSCQVPSQWGWGWGVDKVYITQLFLPWKVLQSSSVTCNWLKIARSQGLGPSLRPWSSIPGQPLKSDIHCCPSGCWSSTMLLLDRHSKACHIYYLAVILLHPCKVGRYHLSVHCNWSFTLIQQGSYSYFPPTFKAFFSPQHCQDAVQRRTGELSWRPCRLLVIFPDVQAAWIPKRLDALWVWWPGP